MSKINLSIQSLRAIAILLVVIGHVIGSDSMGGMKFEYPSWWRFIYSYIDYIQMPLFSAIAGWVYGLNRAKKIGVSSFMFGKFKRLLVPMAAVSTIYFVVQYFVPGTNVKGDFSDLWRIYLYPYTVYWYLQSLFLIFFVAYLADKFSLLESFKSWGVVVFATYLIYVIQYAFISDKVDNYFSFQGAASQLIYFVAGIGIVRFGKELSRFKHLAYVVAFLGLCFLHLKWFYPEYLELYYLELLYLCLLPIWLLGTLLIVLNLKIESKYLVYIGSYTYSIYLFHAFGTGGGRIVLMRLGLSSEVLIFIGATIISIVMPIVIDMVLSKNRYTRMIFLGKPM